MHYVTVFDASYGLWRHWWMVLPPALGLVAGALGLFSRRRLASEPEVDAADGYLPPRLSPLFNEMTERLKALAMVLVGGLVLYMVLGTAIENWLQARHDLRSGACTITEGQVTDHRPVPGVLGGKGHRRFAVNGVAFGIGPYDLSPGYQAPIWGEDPNLRNGAQVRLCHNRLGILRLEVAQP